MYSSQYFATAPTGKVMMCLFQRRDKKTKIISNLNAEENRVVVGDASFQTFYETLKQQLRKRQYHVLRGDHLSLETTRLCPDKK